MLPFQRQPSFVCFARKIDGDSWFTWWFNHLPGKLIYFSYASESTTMRFKDVCFFPGFSSFRPWLIWFFSCQQPLASKTHVPRPFSEGAPFFEDQKPSHAGLPRLPQGIQGIQSLLGSSEFPRLGASVLLRCETLSRKIMKLDQAPGGGGRSCGACSV